MGFNGSEPSAPARTPVPALATALKIAVVGPLGVGKTTLVTSVSEISPLTTEETMTREGTRLDVLDRGSTKSTTTVAMDFGRISLSESIVLYLFGTPGQERFWFLWDGLVDGALGAVVLVDVRRLEESFEVLERLERRGAAFIVAANGFPQAPVYPVETLRQALDLPDAVPVLNFDARSRADCRRVLIALTEYLLVLARLPRAEAEGSAGSPGPCGPKTRDSAAALEAAAEQRDQVVRSARG